MYRSSVTLATSGRLKEFRRKVSCGKLFVGGLILSVCLQCVIVKRRRSYCSGGLKYACWFFVCLLYFFMFFTPVCQTLCEINFLWIYGLFYPFVNFIIISLSLLICVLLFSSFRFL